MAEVFQTYGLTVGESKPIVDALRKTPVPWVDFMMRFELGLEKPDPKRAVISAATIAGAYIAGGFVPLGPYWLLHTARTALTVSVVTTLIALAIFGYIKGHFTGAPQRHPNSAHRWAGGDRGILDRASNFVMAQTLVEPLREWTIKIRETAGQGS